MIDTSGIFTEVPQPFYSYYCEATVADRHGNAVRVQRLQEAPSGTEQAPAEATVIGRVGSLHPLVRVRHLVGEGTSPSEYRTIVAVNLRRGQHRRGDNITIRGQLISLNSMRVSEVVSAGTPGVHELWSSLSARALRTCNIVTRKEILAKFDEDEEYLRQARFALMDNPQCTQASEALWAEMTRVTGLPLRMGEALELFEDLEEGNLM
ncbi:hypothetical protein DFS34DRAFT_653777 [Phlyctochytrium arcticum]|nr:hypothetical protein DFS34DRAFT_653777 [Phlyctochytrium arcticum]